jgi:hypothetical protein
MEMIVRVNQNSLSFEESDILKGNELRLPRTMHLYILTRTHREKESSNKKFAQGDVKGRD